MTALAGGKNLEKKNGPGDLRKDLASLKNEILSKNKDKKEVKLEKNTQENTKAKEQIQSKQENKEKQTGVDVGIEEKMNAAYEDAEKSEAYSSGGGGKTPTIKTKEANIQRDDGVNASYILPPRSPEALKGIKDATKNVERDISEMSSLLLGKKTGSKIAERLIK